MAQICQDEEGNFMPFDASIELSGVPGKSCTDYWPYKVGEQDDSKVLLSDGVLRKCRFCSGIATNQWIVNSLKPPVSANRKIQGISMWTADTAALTRWVGRTTPSLTKVYGKAVPVSGCTSTTQTVMGMKGQEVMFSIDSPIPVAPGWYIYFTNSGGEVDFMITAAGAFSGQLECGAKVWRDGEVTFQVSAAEIKVQLPSVNPEGTVPLSLQTNEAICDEGFIKFTIREWTDTQLQEDDPVAVMSDANCYICEGSPCTLDDSNSLVTAVLTRNSDASFEFKQDKKLVVLWSLEIESQTFQPLTEGSYGRFYFKPRLSAGAAISLYAGKSRIDYTFGNYTFNSNSICQIMNIDAGNTGKPGSKFSTSVSQCEVTGKTVKLSIGKDTDINFFVQILGNNKHVNSETEKITGDLQNFGSSVLVHSAIHPLQLKGGGNIIQAETDLNLTKSMTNVLDHGTLTFEFALQKPLSMQTWDKFGFAFIEFPKYYRPDIGESVQCTLQDKTGKLLEYLYCDMQWDWSLKIWGPQVSAVELLTTYKLCIIGVEMNAFTSGTEEFQLGFLKSKDNYGLAEYGQVKDTDPGKWESTQPITIHKITAAKSGYQIRTTVSLQVQFFLPLIDKKTMEGSNFVILTFPFQWHLDETTNGQYTGRVHLTEDTLTEGLTSSESVKVTQSSISFTANSVYVVLDAGETLLENQNYTLSVTDIPAPSDAVEGFKTADLGSFVLSVGKTSSGGTGYSSSSLFTFQQPKFSSEKKILIFEPEEITVNKGTYSENPICIQQTTGKFIESVQFSLKETEIFALLPEKIGGYQGMNTTCGHIGASQDLELPSYLVHWTKSNGASYTNLPLLKVNIGSTIQTVNVAKQVKCAKGGMSVPIMVSVSAIPFDDITVQFDIGTPGIVGTPTPAEEGINIDPDDNLITFNSQNTEGILRFTCDKEAKGTKLTYLLNGTNKDAYKLSSNHVVIVLQDKTPKPAANPSMNIVNVVAESTANDMVIFGLCPEVGEGWIYFKPQNAMSNSSHQIVNEFNKFKTKIENVKQMQKQGKAKYPGTFKLARGPQYCHRPIGIKAEGIKCNFKVASLRQYVVSLYCQTINMNFYHSEKPKIFQSKSNSQKIQKISLIYGKDLNVHTHNEVVNKVICAISEELELPKFRITDELGGTCDKPSVLLKQEEPEPQPSNTSGNATAGNATTGTATAATTGSRRLGQRNPSRSHGLLPKERTSKGRYENDQDRSKQILQSGRTLQGNSTATRMLANSTAPAIVKTCLSPTTCPEYHCKECVCLAWDTTLKDLPEVESDRNCEAHCGSLSCTVLNSFIDFYLLPDEYAEDFTPIDDATNDKTGLISTRVDKITNASFGLISEVKSIQIDEQEVLFTVTPKPFDSQITDKSISITGQLNLPGYVYCWIQASKARLLQEERALQDEYKGIKQVEQAEQGEQGEQAENKRMLHEEAGYAEHCHTGAGVAEQNEWYCPPDGSTYVTCPPAKRSNVIKATGDTAGLDSYIFRRHQTLKANETFTLRFDSLPGGHCTLFTWNCKATSSNPYKPLYETNVTTGITATKKRRPSNWKGGAKGYSLYFSITLSLSLVLILFDYYF